MCGLLTPPSCLVSPYQEDIPKTLLTNWLTVHLDPGQKPEILEPRPRSLGRKNELFLRMEVFWLLGTLSSVIPRSTEVIQAQLREDTWTISWFPLSLQSFATDPFWPCFTSTSHPLAYFPFLLLRPNINWGQEMPWKELGPTLRSRENCLWQKRNRHERIGGIYSSSGSGEHNLNLEPWGSKKYDCVAMYKDGDAKRPKRVVTNTCSGHVQTK